MAVKSITRWEFNQYVPQSYLLEHVFGDGVAWFADRSNRIIGTVAKSERERHWFYIILEREADGSYQVCQVQSGFESQQVASVRLTPAMESAAKLSATR